MERDDKIVRLLGGVEERAGRNRTRRLTAAQRDLDLVHRDPREGEIVVAYPFSGTSTAHRVRLDRRREVYAMCAVDALGIPFMLSEPGEIRSRDPLTGAEISVRIQPGVAVDGDPSPPSSCGVPRVTAGRARRRAVSSCSSSHPRRTRGAISRGSHE